MDEIEVFHGSVDVVQRPLCNYGRPDLDFGRGFYLTDIKAQAIEWAKRISSQKGGQALINIYKLNKSAFLEKGRCKIFKSYDFEWLEFIVASRNGDNPAEDYDYIEGGVANDRVIDTVNLYMAGLITREQALRNLVYKKPNNQISLLNQSLTDKYLIYERFETL